MRVIGYLGTAGALALLIVAFESGGAQPYSRQELLNRGNSNLHTNCVVSAMNYYAILQQFPGWPNSAAAQQMRNRIAACRNGSVGLAGADSKTDDLSQPSGGTPLPPIASADASLTPQVKACRAYASTAMAQVQAKIDSGCNQGGARWSTNYNVHYNWCINSGTPQELRNENQARSDVLNQCAFNW